MNHLVMVCTIYFDMKKNKERLRCDAILISDTGIIANDTPSITTGLRGLSYMEVEVKGPNRDLHSGLYGGAVANPINILCEMIAKMKDENRNRRNVCINVFSPFF